MVEKGWHAFVVRLLKKLQVSRQVTAMGLGLAAYLHTILNKLVREATNLLSTFKVHSYDHRYDVLNKLKQLISEKKLKKIR